MKFQKALALVAAVSVSGFCATAQAAIKVGVVDFQEALLKSKRGRDIKATLEKEAEGKRKQFEKEQGELQKAGQDYQKKKALLSEKKREEQEMELQKKVMSFQEKWRGQQEELRGKENAATGPIIQELKDLVPQIASKEGLEIVIDASTIGPGGQPVSALVYAANKVDITKQLIELFDKGAAKKK